MDDGRSLPPDGGDESLVGVASSSSPLSPNRFRQGLVRLAKAAAFTGGKEAVGLGGTLKAFRDYAVEKAGAAKF
jgi:hypothetical protein